MVFIWEGENKIGERKELVTKLGMGKKKRKGGRRGIKERKGEDGCWTEGRRRK